MTAEPVTDSLTGTVGADSGSRRSLFAAGIGASHEQLLDDGVDGLGNGGHLGNDGAGHTGGLVSPACTGYEIVCHGLRGDGHGADAVLDLNGGGVLDIGQDAARQSDFALGLLDLDVHRNSSLI